LFLQLGPTQIPIGNSNSTTNLDVKPTTGSASLSYTLNPNVHTYISYGRSFRAGGQGTNTNGANYDKYYHYKDELSDGLEVGIKSSLLNRKLQFNADVYYQRFDGYQSGVNAALRTDLVNQNFLGLGGFVYNSKAIAKGMELGLIYAFPNRIVFNLDAAYNKAAWADGVIRPVSIKDAS